MSETLKGASDHRNEWEETMASAPEFAPELKSWAWELEGCKNPFKDSCSMEEVAQTLDKVCKTMDDENESGIDKTQESMQEAIDYYGKRTEKVSCQENDRTFLEARKALDEQMPIGFEHDGVYDALDWVLNHADNYEDSNYEDSMAVVADKQIAYYMKKYLDTYRLGEIEQKDPQAHRHGWNRGEEISWNIARYSQARDFINSSR